MRTRHLTPLLLLAAACASQPSMDRPSVPDRPVAQRPDGLEPAGLTEVRDSISGQRAEARSRENAMLINRSDLSTNPTGPTWYETVLGVIDGLIHVAGF